MEEDLRKAGSLALASYLYQLLGSTASTALLALASIVIARLLEPEGYGVYSLSLAIPAAISGIADLGLDLWIVRTSSRISREGRLGEALGTSLLGILLVALASSILALLVALYSGFIASSIMGRPGLAPLIALSALLIPAASIGGASSSALLGLGLPSYIGLIQLVMASTKLALSAALLAVGLGVYGAIASHVIGYWVSSIFGLSALLILVGRRARPRLPGRGEFRGALAFSSPLFASKVAGSASSQYIYSVISRSISPGDLGGFQAASNLLSPLSLVSSPILMSILPAASRLGGGEAIRISLLRTTAYSSALISPIALLTSILSYEALQIVYGSVYAGFWWILTVLSASHILLAILGSHVTASYTLVQGDSKSYMYASMMGIASQVVIITMLVPTLGVIGILAAQVISSISGSLYLLIKISRELGIEIREILSKSSMPVLASLAASIPLLIASISARHSPMALGLAGLAYAVLYIAALPILGLGRAELEGLQKILEGSGLLSRLAAPILRYMIYIRALASRIGIAV